MKVLLVDMLIEEKIDFLNKCKEKHYSLNHKYLGMIQITRIEEDVFYANTSTRGEMAFLYNDLGLTISYTPAPAGETLNEKCVTVSNNKNNKSDEWYVDKVREELHNPFRNKGARKTLFPSNETTTSEKRHNLNSVKSLRK